MIANKVERHVIKKSHKMYSICDDYCFKAKELYNVANYTIRQSFVKENKFIPYSEMWKSFKSNEYFKAIGSNSGQHVLKMLEKSWKSFFMSVKDYSKSPSKYFGKPKLPGYLKKDGRYVWVLTNVQSKIIDGYLKFSFKPLHPFNYLIKTRVKGKHLQTRIIPKGTYYVLEIVYETKVIDSSPETSRILGLDIGLNRLVTSQNNIGVQPIAINGGSIKAVNNYYNKKIAKLKRVAKKRHQLDVTNRMETMIHKRKFKMDYLLHTASKKIVDWCIDHQIDTVVIGYNAKWKQNAKMFRTTQHFVQVPFHNFVSKLEYKLLDKGIKLIKTEESYTSGCSFLDEELPCKENYNKDRRIHRGLFKASNRSIHADVNGAGNIIKKVFPEAFSKGIKDVYLHPVIINL